MRNYPIPPVQKMINEAFSWTEIPELFLRGPSLLGKPRGDGQRIIVVPGFSTGDISTLPLRQYLASLGYRVSGWNMGVNSGDVLDAIARLNQRVQTEHAAEDEQIILIGWSLGGYLAREVARELPHAVAQVITMGTPVVGGPKYTRVAEYFRSSGMDLNEIEREVDARTVVPLKVPVTAIYSKRDGVVAWEACIDETSDTVEHVEVMSSHIGMGISSTVYNIISTRLAA
jgi:pimeloyl-ACP methyl ester carboxylesterase